MTSGLSLEGACDEAGVSTRTVQRWRLKPGSGDGRHGPKRRPGNALTEAERRQVLKVANSPEFRDMSPKQIVPALADRKQYVASESTFYRVLRQEGQLTTGGAPSRAGRGPCPRTRQPRRASSGRGTSRT